jgi:hypothetical protein
MIKRRTSELSAADWAEVRDNLIARTRRQNRAVPVRERQPSRFMCWIGLWHPLLLLIAAWAILSFY